MLTRCVIFRGRADVPDVGGGGRLDVQPLAFFPLAWIDPLCYFCSRLKELFVPD